MISSQALVELISGVSFNSLDPESQNMGIPVKRYRPQQYLIKQSPAMILRLSG